MRGLYGLFEGRCGDRGRGGHCCCSCWRRKGEVEGRDGGGGGDGLVCGRDDEIEEGRRVLPAKKTTSK